VKVFVSAVGEAVTCPLGLMLRSFAKRSVSKHVAALVLRDAAFGGSSG
jgi:hypothetical protein